MTNFEFKTIKDMMKFYYSGAFNDYISGDLYNEIRKLECYL